MVEKLLQYVKPFSSIPERYGRTDRQTHRQTGGQTEFLYQHRASVCWRAIKMNHKHIVVITYTILYVTLNVTNVWHSVNHNHLSNLFLYPSRTREIAFVDSTSWVEWVTDTDPSPMQICWPIYTMTRSPIVSYSEFSCRPKRHRLIVRQHNTAVFRVLLLCLRQCRLRRGHRLLVLWLEGTGRHRKKNLYGPPNFEFWGTHCLLELKLSWPESLRLSRATFHIAHMHAQIAYSNFWSRLFVTSYCDSADAISYKELQILAIGVQKT